MMPSTIVKRCPKCNWNNEVDRGDRLHPHCSTDKPKQTDVTENVITKIKYCRNPKCAIPIRLYYFRAKPVFKLR